MQESANCLSKQKTKKQKNKRQTDGKLDKNIHFLRVMISFIV